MNRNVPGENKDKFSPAASMKAKSSFPVDRITLSKSALNNNKGIDNGKRNSKTIEYAGAS